MSSAPFVLAIVAMLLVAGGLIAWKLGKKEQQVTVVTVLVPTSAAPEPPALEEPPPPPPPPVIEEPDAGTQAKPSARQGTSTAGGGSCAGECKGTPAGPFAAQLAAVARRAQSCYERALRQNEQLQGRLSVSLRVGPNGQVCSANIGMNQTGDPGLNACVLQIFRASSFAAPKNGCVDAEVPLNFVPKR